MVDAPAPDAAPESAQALIPANQNPWYVLATLHGEQPEGARWWAFDPELHARNRLTWNRWAAQALSEEKRRALGERRDGSGQPVYSECELTPYSAEELAALERRWQQEWTRRNPSLPEPHLPDSGQSVDCETVHFERPVIWRDFVVPGDAEFENATFSGSAVFVSATFSGYAGFANATFSGNARFRRATFSGRAGFRKATFSRKAGFDNATFSGDAGFDNATFYGHAGFANAIFSGQAAFENVNFSGQAAFENAIFSGHAEFGKATFSGRAGFGKATFSDNAGFANATFSGQAAFENAIFSGHAGFWKATFSGRAAFENAIFSGHAGFGKATFSGRAGFGKASFSGVAKFRGATFSGQAGFRNAAFSGDAEFGSATFFGYAGFKNATFSGIARFQKATFSGDAGFENAKLQSSTSFARARFTLHPPRFHGASLHEGTQWHGAQWPPPPDDAEDAQQHVYAYERLKQEMERLKKHDDELQFFEREMRCRRIVEDQHLPAGRLKRVIFFLKGDGWSGLLNRAYDWFSGYGRSIFRPMLGLLATFVLGIAAMVQAACWPGRAGSCPAILTLDSPFIAFKQAILLSFANMLAPLNVRKDFFDADMLAELSGWLKIVGGLQTLLALGFAFLIGLALRNRFRLR